MRVPVILTAAALALSGCGFTQQGSFLRDAAQTRGAEAYDAGLDNAEWFMCNAASIGSIKRKYGISEQKAAAYRVLCGAGADADVIVGPVE